MFWAISEAVARKRPLIHFTDDYVPHSVRTSLVQNAFIEVGSLWTKFNLPGIHDQQDVEDIINRFCTKYPSLTPVWDKIQCTVEATKDELQQAGFLEKLFWPLKLANVELPTYIVPIKPKWAIDLFDSRLGRQTLFGSDPNLMFSMDNVYYRRVSTKLPTAPSRVLWYVSKGDEPQLQGTMAIRACSYVEEVVIGTPAEIFKKFSNLGVYRWQDVLATANDQLNTQILAFRFSHTELFNAPISFEEWKKIKQQKLAPLAPVPITGDAFLTIYRQGTER